MDAQLASWARDWHDFYTLVGTAAATLVGLMFVAASIGANIFDEKHLEPMTAFITPTVFHFSIALLTCILATIPTETWALRRLLIGGGSLAGLTYSGAFGSASSAGIGRGSILPTGSSMPSSLSSGIWRRRPRRWLCGCRRLGLRTSWQSR